MISGTACATAGALAGVASVLVGPYAGLVSGSALIVNFILTAALSVASGVDAQEFLANGAALVAVGTENFRDPKAGSRVAAELAGAPARVLQTP